MVAVKPGSPIWISSNYGGSFTQSKSPSCTYKSLWVSADGNIIYGITVDGEVVRSLNGGLAWDTPNNLGAGSWLLAGDSLTLKSLVALPSSPSLVAWTYNLGAFAYEVCL